MKLNSGGSILSSFIESIEHQTETRTLIDSNIPHCYHSACQLYIKVPTYPRKIVFDTPNHPAMEWRRVQSAIKTVYNLDYHLVSRETEYSHLHLEHLQHAGAMSCKLKGIMPTRTWRSRLEELAKSGEIRTLVTNSGVGHFLQSSCKDQTICGHGNTDLRNSLKGHVSLQAF